MSEKFTVTQEEIDELLDSSKTEEKIFANGREMCVVYILPSGFTVNGRSAMLDPTHFDLEIGRETVVEKLQDSFSNLRLIASKVNVTRKS